MAPPASLNAQERRKRFRQPVDDLAGQPIEFRINSSILIHAELIRSIGAATAVARGHSMMSPPDIDHHAMSSCVLPLIFVFFEPVISRAPPPLP
jgi:hypothetical protein